MGGPEARCKQCRNASLPSNGQIRRCPWLGADPNARRQPWSWLNELKVLRVKEDLEFQKQKYVVPEARRQQYGNSLPFNGQSRRCPRLRNDSNARPRPCAS